MLCICGILLYKNDKKISCDDTEINYHYVYLKFKSTLVQKKKCLTSKTTVSDFVRVCKNFINKLIVKTVNHNQSYCSLYLFLAIHHTTQVNVIYIDIEKDHR